MLATVEDVAALTNYTVTLEDITLAQGIIEAMLGKVEGEINHPGDLLFASRAVCYQAAYVSKNYETIFEQVAVRGITQTDGTILLDVDLAAPFVAPLAMFALRNMTKRNSRSVKTGSMFGAVVETPWELD